MRHRQGGGMIQPKMATMLAFVMSDAAIARDALDQVFRQSVAGSFNAISVDGCMSTNDTAVILTNGVAGNHPIRRVPDILGAFERSSQPALRNSHEGFVRDGEGGPR